MSLKTGNSIPYGTSGSLVLDELRCPTCKHRWFEFSDEVDIEVCPRCGSELGSWFVVYDGGHFIDSFKSNSFEQAKCDALDTLIEWMSQTMTWDEHSQPTEEQIDEWDYMIESCNVVVIRRYYDDPDDYEEVWEPSDEDLKQIGWMYYDELRLIHA